MDEKETVSECRRDLSFLGVPYDPDCYTEPSDDLGVCRDECCYIDECCC